MQAVNLLSWLTQTPTPFSQTLAGDEIMEVDGKPVRGYNAERVAGLIKGLTDHVVLTVKPTWVDRSVLALRPFTFKLLIRTRSQFYCFTSSTVPVSQPIFAPWFNLAIAFWKSIHLSMRGISRGFVSFFKLAVVGWHRWSHWWLQARPVRAIHNSVRHQEAVIERLFRSALWDRLSQSPIR